MLNEGEEGKEVSAVNSLGYNMLKFVMQVDGKVIFFRVKWNI